MKNLVWSAVLAGGAILMFRPLLTPVQAQTPAFPGAEGYGATASGGRGKHVIAVTNVNDNGKGSFREVVANSNATIIFRISGVIHLKSDLRVGSNLTIDGQTAPGSGVTIADAKVSLSGSTNIIMRYLRFRGGMAESKGASSLNLGDSSHVMLDHLSIEWGRWDNIQTNGNTYTTIQNSIIGEGIDPQRFGCLCESDYLTLSHNLWIDNKSRNPKGKGKIQYVNNVVYNWGVDGYVGGHSAADHYADLVGNYFIAGQTLRTPLSVSLPQQTRPISPVTSLMPTRMACSTAGRSRARSSSASTPHCWMRKQRSLRLR
jgi:hypothetical protein